MNKAVQFIKTLIFFVVLFMLLYMGFIHRAFLWEQTKVARAFYFIWQGDENIKLNNFQKAIDFYKMALKIYPGHVKAHYNLGNIYFWYELYTAPGEKKDVVVFKFDENLRRFTQVVDKKATQSEDTEISAEAAYMKATEVDPNYINAWINLGLVREKQFEIDKAIHAFTKAINANPTIINIPFIYNNEDSIKYNRAVAYFDLAHLYQQKALSTDYPELRENYLREALRYYNKSREINPKSYKVYYNIGHCNQLLKRDTAAVNSYCKAIKVNPLKYEAHYNLGVLLREQGLQVGAADELKKAAILMESGKGSTNTEYVFRLLSDASYRAAASTLTERLISQETTYNIPTEGIIADVIGKPLLEEKERQQKNIEESKAAEDKATTPDNEEVSEIWEETQKEFSDCVTDPDYYQRQKDKYLTPTQWIYVTHELFAYPEDQMGSEPNTNQ